jgi:5-formyltetrahydrofolate cyclo-ligase
MKKNDLYPAALFEQKKAFRSAALAARDILSAEQRKQKSSLIAERLCGLRAVKDACSWFVYVSFQREVETRSLIGRLLAEGKQVSVPSIDESTKTMSASLVTSMEHDLEPGCYGILEPAAGRLQPVESSTIDVVIVPGAAFSIDGFRIGYGGGYYDRFLKNCSAVTIGLAFDMQVVGHVPHEKRWDVPLDFIVTEARLIECKSLRKK